MGGYAFAALLGACFPWLVVPADVVLGVGPAWQSPADDLAQNLTGHLAFQQDAWRWPPLLARNLLWPDGISIVLTDSNPLVSVIAKLAAGVVGAPVNLFGAWLALCWLLQPVGAVYVVRGLGAKGFAAAAAAAVIALSFPALLARMGHGNLGHINLCGHFLVLLGLGWSIRRVADAAAPWWQAMLLATVAIFSHPFFFIILCCLYAPPVVARVLARSGFPGAAAGYAASLALPYGLFAILSGVTGGGEFGYGLFSMNLASPFWPQRSGLFGADLPVLDATTGQYEGVNYLGAGALLLLAVAAVLLALRRGALPGWRVWIGHAFVALALTGLALSHKVYLGPWAILSIEAGIIERVMGPVRASGRLFWPVGYMLALVPVALVARRLPRPWAAAVLVLAAVLQWADAAPWRGAVREAFAMERDRSGGVALPAQAKLLTATTHCGLPGVAGTHVDWLRLDAIRAGMALGDMRLSRTPPARACETVVSDAWELPLQPGEVRGFVGRPGMAAVRTDLLGPGAWCRQGRTMILCSAGPATGWDEAAIGAPVLPLLPGETLAAERLAPFLGWGWLRDREDRFWSSGRRAVLLFRMPALAGGARLRLGLQVEGIGARAGRAIAVRATSGTHATPFAGQGWTEAMLDDGKVVPMELEIAPTAAPGGIVRVVIEIPEPTDPRVRGVAMPVRRAGLKMHRLTVVAAE